MTTAEAARVAAGTYVHAPTSSGGAMPPYAGQPFYFPNASPDAPPGAAPFPDIDSGPRHAIPAPAS